MKLIFVYNAKSGVKTMVKDFFHKLISPSTYPCSLCDLTYGFVSERKEWKDFINRMDIDMDFHHIDDFEDKYQQKFIYPVVVGVDNSGELSEIISKEELDAFSSLEHLMKDVEYRIQKIVS